MSAYLSKQQTRCVRVYVFIFGYVCVFCRVPLRELSHGVLLPRREREFHPASLSSMFDQLNCIKLRIDFAIIGNQSQMDFFFVLLVAHKAVVFNSAFSIFAHIPNFLPLRHCPLTNF